MATFNAGLKRSGPGLLLRDIDRGEDPQIAEALEVIAHIDPDILLITNFDFDLHALTAFADLLEERGSIYPHLFSLPPNAGRDTGMDIDGDGRIGTPTDAHGYAKFSGQGGMALISRFPIIQDFTDFMWKDFPNANLTGGNDKSLRLASSGFWIVPVQLPDNESTQIDLLAYHATTPAFDGIEDRNGWRNHDENAFWPRYLKGEFGSVTSNNFIILGDTNLDPSDGEGHRGAIKALLAHPNVQDPRPKSRGAVQAAHQQGGVNSTQLGDPALDTADWRDVNGPGNLRVDYVLPSKGLEILESGVFWPAKDEPLADVLNRRDPDVSWHGLVWVDLNW